MSPCPFSLIFTLCSACFSQVLTVDSAVEKIPLMKYPTLLRYSGTKGNVKISIELLNGQLTKVVAGESDKVLSNAAIAFVRKFDFKPTSSGSLVLGFQFVLSEKPDPKGHWQRISVEPESNIIIIHASRKISIDIDYFK